MKEKFSGLRPESALVALQYTTYRLTRAIFFFKKQAENEAGRPVLDLFLFLKKLYIRSKQVVSIVVDIQEKQTV